jgi:hypothetical protein
VKTVECKISLENIHPTQFLLGMVSIPKKIKKVNKAIKKGELDDFLKEKVLPVVIGPDGLFYILDGHHSTYALLKSKAKNKYVYVSIDKNCSDCSMQEFISYMEDGRSYLYDNDFVKQDFNTLPKTLNALKDSPYRSLSWLVRKEGCYNKVKVNFLEFLWAKVLMDEMNLDLTGADKKELKTHIEASCNIVRKLKYSSMPGYVGSM